MENNKWSVTLDQNKEQHKLLSQLLKTYYELKEKGVLDGTVCCYKQ